MPTLHPLHRNHTPQYSIAPIEARARAPVHYTVPAAPRCCFCGRALSRFARLGPLRAGP